MEYLANFTTSVLQSNTALDAQITRNNVKLEQQAEIISRTQARGRLFDLTTSGLLIAVMTPWIRSAGPALAVNVGITVALFLSVWKVSRWMPVLSLSLSMMVEESSRTNITILVKMLVPIAIVCAAIIIFRAWRRQHRSDRLWSGRNSHQQTLLEYQPLTRVPCEGKWSFAKAGV